MASPVANEKGRPQRKPGVQIPNKSRGAGGQNTRKADKVCTNGEHSYWGDGRSRLSPRCRSPQRVESAVKLRSVGGGGQAVGTGLPLVVSDPL